MTIIVRRQGPVKWWRLRRCGVCRIGLAEVVGVFASTTNRVIFLN